MPSGAIWRRRVPSNYSITTLVRVLGFFCHQSEKPLQVANESARFGVVKLKQEVLERLDLASTHFVNRRLGCRRQRDHDAAPVTGIGLALDEPSFRELTDHQACVGHRDAHTLRQPRNGSGSTHQERCQDPDMTCASLSRWLQHFEGAATRAKPGQRQLRNQRRKRSQIFIGSTASPAGAA